MERCSDACRGMNGVAQSNQEKDFHRDIHYDSNISRRKQNCCLLHDLAVLWRRDTVLGRRVCDRRKVSFHDSSSGRRKAFTGHVETGRVWKLENITARFCCREAVLKTPLRINCLVIGCGDGTILLYAVRGGSKVTQAALLIEQTETHIVIFFLFRLLLLFFCFGGVVSNDS
eukprot:Blabericola_migrator_1__9374@NODE_5057_length_888_cov_545_216809_g3197_i0_p1_GENE_NODE_5057_length_888_cov_545_216809_g3197_i0NODE_5057_length_888_cov_545_216809_g3197_i0_p1_ORF_typecomplete_len172_score5_88CMAS/PF02353_20/0_14_NODE_5057_length_888_cov_545_216809_g3197_i078593